MPSMTGKKHSEETKAKMRARALGRKMSPEACRKIGIAKKGTKHSDETKRKMSEAKKGKKPNNYGKKLSLSTRKKMSDSRRGEKCHLWKGGTTPLKKLVRSSTKYKEWRNDCFIRDDYTCQSCEIRGGVLHAHHKKEFYKIFQEARMKSPLFSPYDACMAYEPLWDADNGVTLCEDCHLQKNFNYKLSRAS